MKYMYTRSPITRRKNRTKRVKNTKKIFNKQRILRYRGGNTTTVTDNSNKTIVIFTINSSSGFFSMMGFLNTVYIYATKNKYQMFIEHDNWQYTYNKGWHDYFTTLTIYDPNDTRYIGYKIERYVSGDATPNSVMYNIPRYTIREHIEALKQIYIHQPHIQEQIINKRKEYGKYTSLYVRRGDKADETKLMTTQQVIDKTSLSTVNHPIFIQTDDYTAVEEIKQLMPNSTILTETLPTQRGASNRNNLNISPEERKCDTEQLFISIGVALGGTKIWSYYNSNICIFYKLYEYDRVSIYVDDQYSIETINKIYELDNSVHLFNLYTNEALKSH